VELEGVVHRMPGGVTALDGVTLSLREGELVAVVGGNGAGKTTLLKHLNGLLKPDRGEVRVFGRSTRELSIAELSRQVGLVFQNSDHQLFSENVRGEISFGLKNFGMSEEEIGERVKRAMEFYNLTEMAERAPLTLSGGEKKRLCIAAVMAWEPKVLALDEPTVGQDYQNKVKLLGLVRRMVDQGRTVIIVSHDLEFLWPLHPRTVVLSQGRIVADGPAEDVFMDLKLLESSGLRQPQLAQLAVALGRGRPFRDVDEAVDFLSGGGA
jgi:energy-coupling factor transport system ATP-binding protein